ncbi:hypothetical protein SAMN04488540_1147 [Ferrimonas sediminum]|uniref:Uncharacterized protein n=1 Tax=Ferrimonas sediminum TaxID=718193 RepID=A0A1G8WWJ3_9GAMM|nr:hypothetical protein [Ferrimonas sediminum]SDJ81985.1 hypothetical protein SAMN04488540_1147 [Ferrimonas sediminum]
MVKRLVVLIVGIMLGAIISYVAVTKLIALRGGAGMHGFVDAADAAVKNENAVDLVTCMKLAKLRGVPVNHFKLNLVLNSELKRYDNGTGRAFNILVYVKGYGIGIADGAEDKDELFSRLNCAGRFSDVIGEN